MAINDITGDNLISRAPSDQYRENYDKIFGRKKVQSEPVTESDDKEDEKKTDTE